MDAVDTAGIWPLRFGAGVEQDRRTQTLRLRLKSHPGGPTEVVMDFDPVRVISNFPYLVPPSLTVWDTAAAPASQIFMLLGTLLLLPFVIGYVVMIYWLFRGNVREGESYH